MRKTSVREQPASRWLTGCHNDGDTVSRVSEPSESFEPLVPQQVMPIVTAREAAIALGAESELEYTYVRMGRAKRKARPTKSLSNS